MNRLERDAKGGGHAIIFDTPEDLLEFVLGPSQHDHHVKDREKHLWLKARHEWLDAADTRLKAATNEMIARMRARRAAQ